MDRTQDQTGFMSRRSFGSKGQSKHLKEAGPSCVPKSVGCFFPMPRILQRNRERVVRYFPPV